MSDPFASLREALADRYRIEEQLGRGGMSVVFRARDLRHDRDVALKVLLPELAATLARERFLREIELESSLDHPNVVPVLDSGEEAGFLFVALELVEGESLRERLTREGPLPVDEALSIFEDVAAALGYAHKQGIVHRDVKPGNILLGPDGIRVTDFGIARAVTAVAGATLTESGLTIGTPAYMSPEQAGEARNVDARADIYSLGCVLFEMLAGEAPFQGPTAQAVIARHMMEQIPAVSVVRPGVPEAVERAIRRALSKVPADRFSDVDAFVAAASESWPAADDGSGRGRLAGVVAVVVALGLLAVWAPWNSADGLDSERIVVFPLTEIGIEGDPGAQGETVALGIGTALEATAPLRWEDGYTWLAPEQREDIRRLTAEEARRITRERGARYRMEGELVRRADSVHVILRLHDLRTGRIERRTERAPAGGDGAVQAGLRATVALLPSLLGQEGEYDLPGILDRDPGGVALWMLGNRAYRESRLDEALALYRRALDADPRLAMAALRAAPAASWDGDLGEAASMVEHALAYGDLMPPRFVDFAHGLRHYLSGSADSALARLRSALAADSLWEDAWMAVGEVHRHLLPEGGGGGPAALKAFRRAREVDPDFAPPLYHIAELSAWLGQRESARGAIARLREGGRPEADVRIVELVARCAGEEMSPEAWRRAADEGLGSVFEAATSLALSQRHLTCSTDAYRALLDVEGLDEEIAGGRYDSALGLQSVLVARGMGDSASVVVARAVDGGIGFAAGLWVLDATVGAPTRPEARRFLERQFGAPEARAYGQLGGRALWLLSQWESDRGDVHRLDRIAEAAEAELAEAETRGGSRLLRLFRDVTAARLLLARGDSLPALERLEALRPTAPRVDLLWSLWEPLASERIAQAELLLALGRPADAARVAAELDNPAAIVHLLYLPRSLEIRIEAAERMGHDARAGELRDRLSRLRHGEGRDDSAP